MKLITLLITSLVATAAISRSDGIPVDRRTGEVTVAHTVVPLTADQIEETQTLGTFTLTTEQWRDIRAKSPFSPKRFTKILPATWSDCTCCVGDEDGYVIALSRDRIAVLHGEDSEASVRHVLHGLFKDRSPTILHINERGEFHLDGMLVPYQTLLKAFAQPTEGVKRDEEGKLLVTVSEHGRVYNCLRVLEVALPMGAKPTDAVYASRLKQVAAAANRSGFWVMFMDEESEPDN